MREQYLRAATRTVLPADTDFDENAFIYIPFGHPKYIFF